MKSERIFIFIFCCCCNINKIASRFGMNTTSSASTATTATAASSLNSQTTKSNNEQSSFINQSKDAQTMISVLKDMGIEDFEPRVVNQLLEFSYSWCLALFLI